MGGSWRGNSLKRGFESRDPVARRRREEREEEGVEKAGYDRPRHEMSARHPPATVDARKASEGPSGREACFRTAMRRRVEGDTGSRKPRRRT